MGRHETRMDRRKGEDEGCGMRFKEKTRGRTPALPNDVLAPSPVPYRTVLARSLFFCVRGDIDAVVSGTRVVFLEHAPAPRQV